jgi:hypothetical protein
MAENMAYLNILFAVGSKFWPVFGNLSIRVEKPTINQD